MPRCQRAAELFGSIRSSLIALACYAVGGLAAMPAASAALHPTVSVSAQSVGFYAGHVVLDARGEADLNDGVVRVQADRIIVDLRANRYVAAGHVTVTGLNIERGDALGVDLATHEGVLLAAGAPSPRLFLHGAVPSESAPATPPQEPLALPDTGFEQPYAVAKRAVAHLDADVRLAGARIIVPGGQSVPLPSYVFTFSSDPGYVVTNINTSGEDIPIYYGSTPNSIQGVHFSYSPQIKLAIGLDDHIVFGNRAYDLLSFAPLIGPNKVFNFTWQEHINDHTSQTLNSSTAFGIGTANNYDLRDSVHRSFLDLTAGQFLGSNSATLGWQSFDQAIGAPNEGKLFFHLRSEYGYTHVAENFPFAPFPPDVVLPNSVYHQALESFVGTQAFNLGPNASISASADARAETDTLPHRQLGEFYTARLDNRWNRIFSTTLADTESPLYDFYPSQATGFHTHISTQTLQLSYDHGDPFALRIGIDHAAARTDNPTPLVVIPWTLTADVRFRINQSLALDLSRSYFFNFNGQRFSSLGFQILP